MEAVIVGGGLVGYLMAILLAKVGWRVTVLEKYRDPRMKRPECIRSINLTLGTRGEAGLDKVGLLEKVKAESMPAYGRVVYDTKGRETGRATYGEKGESIGSIQRFGLNLLLLDTADAMDNVKVLFQHELVTCDFEDGEILVRCCVDDDGSIEDKKFEERKFRADLFIGADGAHSAMRCEMLKQKKLDHVNFKYHDHYYMEMAIPPSISSSSSGEGDVSGYQMDKDMLHVFPKDTFTLICLPNHAGSFSGTLVMPLPQFQKALSSPDKLVGFFKENFPSVLRMVGAEGLVEQFKPGQINGRTPCRLVSLECQPWHTVSPPSSKTTNINGKKTMGANFLLIGDAAHAMVPFYGQGMNTGFEDCLVFMDKLTQHGWQTSDAIGRALRDFSTARCQDGQAMAKFSYQHYTALCRGVKGNNYSIRRFMDGLLHRIFPESWIPEYTMIAFTRIPFSKCQVECQRQDAVIRWCLIVMFLLVVIIVGVLAFAL